MTEQGDDTQPMTHANMRELLDRLDILQLKAKAARTFDNCNADAYADCFTNDGLYESPKIGLRAEGREELRRMCLERKGQDVHVVTNIEIELEGDEAFVRSTLLLARREGEVISTTGRYEAHCVRTPDGWRFSKKASFLDRRG